MFRPRRLLAPVLVALAALLATGPATDGSFVYDDDLYVVDNEAVTGSGSAWSSPHGHARQGLWRPVTVASYRWQWAGADAARAFHRFDVLLHVVASLLVLGLARRLGLAPSPAAAAALLFAVHPVHAEAVAWVTGRAELLAGVFGLAAWIAHLSRYRGSAALSATCLLLAGLSKENALVAPALFLAGDVALRTAERGVPWKRLGLLGAVSVLVFASRLVALPQLLPVDGPYVGLSLGDRAVVAWNVLGKALQLLAWPDALRVEYQKDEFTFGHFDRAWTVAVAIALFLLLWRRRRTAALGLALVPLGLLPVLHLVPIGEPFAERFLYLPSVGICLALGSLFGTWGQREVDSGRGLGASVATLTIALCVAIPVSRSAVRVFHDDLTLWAHASRTAPHLALARYNHATFLDQAGRHRAEDRDRPGCIEEFEASLALEPRHVYAAFAHQALGTHATGTVGHEPPDPIAAAHHFRKAIQLLPGLVEVRLNLASLALSTTGVVDRREALVALAPVLEDPGVAVDLRLAAEQIARQLSEPPEATGTSSSEGS